MHFKLLLSAALAAGLQAAPALAQQSENTLRWTSTAPLTTIDPYFNYHREAMLLNGQLVWDTLVYKTSEGDYLPLLATEWEWVDDKTLEFKLRDDVQWHDGEPFTIDDAIYTFNYISNPENGVNVQSNVNWIDSAEAVDETTLRLNLKKPFPAAMEYISTLHAILPEGFFGDTGQAGANGRLVGTGPYELAEFVQGDRIRVEAFDGYFADSPKGMPTFDAVVYRTIPDVSTQIAELLSGGVDWIWRVPPDQAEPMSGVPGITVSADETMRISFLSMNLRDMDGGNPMQDMKVREAVAWAIDRQTIVDQVIGEGSTVINSPCFRTQFGCIEDATDIGFDPEKAKALLAEAGYEDGMEVRMTSYRSREWTEAVAGYLANVGIDVSASVLDYANARERVVNNQVNMMLGDWGSYGVNDVSALLNNFFTLSEDDMAQDEAVAEALQTAAETADPDARMEQYQFAVNEIADKLYWYPMWTHPTIYAYSSELEFESHPDENPRFFMAKWADE
ncbi:ABC transporter substrate-binding protein [Roseovarius indicus]|uniref:ABC transporter substrate-binding protein n=1 Tax=Roseovarius indicus TaxID=540747 RepID=UPI0032EE7B44